MFSYKRRIMRRVSRTGPLVLLWLIFRRVSRLSVRYFYMGFRFNGCNGHVELEWRRQSRGRLDKRRHRCLVVLSRAVESLVVRWIEFCFVLGFFFRVLVSAERSEAVKTVASRFEVVFRSVTRGARLSISTGLGLQGSSLTRNESGS